MDGKRTENADRPVLTGEELLSAEAILFCVVAG
jgi:hypothetical protein